LLQRRVISHVLKKIVGYDIPRATCRSASARKIPVVLQIKPVVKRNLLASLNIPAGEDPNSAALQQRLAIRLATVVNEPRQIPVHISVEVLLFTQHENVFISSFATSQRFPLIDPFAYVFDDFDSFIEIASDESSHPMYWRWLGNDWFHRPMMLGLFFWCKVFALTNRWQDWIDLRDTSRYQCRAINSRRDALAPYNL